MADWASLPHELLVLIAELLKKFEDFAAFGSVCKAWHAAASKERFKALFLREWTPYLMLPVRVGDDTRDLYSLAEAEIVASVRFPNLSNRRYYESLGWLLAVDKKGSMCVFDPFSSTEIPLPPFRKSHEFVKKMVLSARPSDPNDPSNFVVALMFRSVMGVAFWKPGDNSWHLTRLRAVYEDITYHAGNYYAFDALNQVISFNILKGFPKEGQVFAPHIYGALHSLGELNNLNVYIVKTPRSLLLVTRTFSSGYGETHLSSGRTSKFQVYEHVSSSTWNEINNLGNMALFLGCDSSTTIVDASRFPGFVRANHVYFTDDCKRNPFGDISQQSKVTGQDMGIYNLGNGTIDPFDHGEAFNSKVSHLTWIFPFLWSSTADEMHTL